MPTKSFLLFFVFLATSLPYAHAQKDSDLANPIRTYKTAIRKLKRGKTVQKQTTLLKQALSSLISSANKRIGEFEAKPELASKERALPEYKKILDKIETALPYLDGHLDATQMELKNEQQSLTKTIAAGYFEKGNADFTKAQETKDKHLALNAYKCYQSAQRHQCSADNLDSLLQQSLAFGRLLYVVNARAVFEINYNWEIDRQFDDVTGFTNKFRLVKFESTVTPATADCSIDIEFRSLDIDTEENENAENYSKEVVVGTETITNSEGETIEVDKMESVTATVNNITVSKTAEWQARVSITAITKNCKLDGFSVSDELTSTITKVTTSGDERALPKRYGTNFPEELMEDDDMAETLISNLYDQIVSRLF